MLQGAFTIGFADEGHVAACGYVDLVPGNKGPDKLKKAGFTP